jgi:hypothetical protein
VKGWQTALLVAAGAFIGSLGGELTANWVLCHVVMR